MLSNQSQAAQRFIAEVRAFEEKYKTKINEFLPISNKTAIRYMANGMLPTAHANSVEQQQLKNAHALLRMEELRKEFFSNPIIHSYLARRADTIRFLRNKPDAGYLTPLELEIYELSSDLFLFREDATNDYFYYSGAQGNGFLFGTKFFETLKKSYNNSTLCVTSSMNVDAIRLHLNKISFFVKNPTPDQEKCPLFLLTPNWNDNHATIMVHIFDPESGQVLSSIFINSWLSKQYSDFITKQFNSEQYPHFLDSSEENEAKKTTAQIISQRCIPFIDASHDIQAAQDDGNCSLYGYNFLDAIAKMLNDKEIAEKIVKLAKLVSEKNVEAEYALQRIFTEDLKNYLPCYYVDGQKKSFADLKEFHLAQRWNLGSDLLSQRYPARMTSEEIVTEPKRSPLFKPQISEKGDVTSVQYVGRNKFSKYVFDNVIAILENEKARLLQKYPTRHGGFLIEVKHNKKREIAIVENIKRVLILDALIEKMHVELIRFEENPHVQVTNLQNNLASMIKTELDSKKLDKYQSWGEKLCLIALNALFSIPLLTIPAKKYFTKTWFFSLEGKTQEATEKALENMKKMKIF